MESAELEFWTCTLEICYTRWYNKVQDNKNIAITDKRTAVITITFSVDHISEHIQGKSYTHCKTSRTEEAHGW